MEASVAREFYRIGEQVCTGAMTVGAHDCTMPMSMHVKLALDITNLLAQSIVER